MASFALETIAAMNLHPDKARMKINASSKNNVETFKFIRDLGDLSDMLIAISTGRGPIEQLGKRVRVPPSITCPRPNEPKRTE